MQLIMIVALFGIVGTASMLPVLSDPEPGTVSRYAAASGEQVTCFTPSPKSTTSRPPNAVMGGMNMVFTATSPLIQFSLSAVGTNNIAGAGGAVGMNIGQGTPPKLTLPLLGGHNESEDFRCVLCQSTNTNLFHGLLGPHKHGPDLLARCEF